jgi:hypothetical protein
MLAAFGYAGNDDDDDGDRTMIERRLLYLIYRYLGMMMIKMIKH